MVDGINGKRLFIFLFMFTVISISITGLLILERNSDSKNNNVVIPMVGTEKNQKYNGNDLEIIETRAEGEHYAYSTLRISGLKNKNVEEKINKDIEMYEEKLKNILEENFEEYDLNYMNSTVMGNFSNVLSIKLSITRVNSKDKYNFYETECLNYNLTNGEKLELADLFLPDTDIDLYIQNSMYKDLLHEYFAEENVFFNTDYWENGKFNYLVGKIDELKFIQMFQKYKKSEKKFDFTNTNIEIIYDEETVYLPYTDCLKDLVIFNKYVTEESIFEKDDIGVKDMYVCSNVYKGSGSVIIIEDITENFRIDARIMPYAGNSIITSERYKEFLETAVKSINDKKEEILEKASTNTEKYYFLTMNFEIYDFYPKYYTEYRDTDITYDAFFVYKREKTYEMAKDDFDNWFEEKLILAYTKSEYEEGSFDYLNSLISKEEDKKCKIESSNSSIAYLIDSDDTIENLEDLFMEGSNYVEIIADVLNKEVGISREEAEKKIKNKEYDLSAYGIVFETENYAVQIGYNSFSRDSIKY